MRARLRCCVVAALLVAACGDSRPVDLQDAAVTADALLAADTTQIPDRAVARDQAAPGDLAPPRDQLVPPDASVPGCATNADCPATAYCHIDGGCVVTGAKMGTCTPRPTMCPEYFSPTCGCDGTTYGNPCMAHAAGVNVAYAGDCKSCQDINQDYVAAVQQAKKCCPQCAVMQCTLPVKNELACPCTTYVEQSNTAALALMAQLEAQWTALACQIVGCPPVPCPPVSGATCGFGATAYCYDN